MSRSDKAVAIGRFRIGHGCPVFIIAEAGVNHNGDAAIGRRLIDAAIAAGADAVKFQSFRADALASKVAPKALYQLQTTDRRESQKEMLRQLELSRDDHETYARYCAERGILFLSTPFDETSADYLGDLGVPAVKISSTDVTNRFLLSHVGRMRIPVLLSTGMSTLDEVREAVAVLCAEGVDDIILLHCVSQYPADAKDANLRAITTLRSEFQVPVGFSDHTVGTAVALAAVAAGACVVEKHFTLDKGLPGPDHKASLEPAELTDLVAGIRRVESYLGSGTKEPAESEKENRGIVRRSIAARKIIRCGEVITEEHLIALRPGTGISPMRRDTVIGRRARVEIAEGELLKNEDFE